VSVAASARRSAVLTSAAIALVLVIAPAAARADFGFLPGDAGFKITATGEGGEGVDRQAGSHPYSVIAELNFKQGPESPGQPGVPFTDGDLRELHLDMAPGLIENPSAVPECSPTDFRTPRESPFGETRSGESCPDRTQIGTAAVRSSLGGGETRTFGVFNLAPTPGVPSRIGFSPYGVPVTLSPHVRETGSEYGLTLDLHNFPQQLNVLGVRVEIWGTPWNVAHDGERGNCLDEVEPSFSEAKCSIGPASENPHLALLTLPTSCAGPLTFHVSASSWQQPGTTVRSTYESAPLEECDQIRFRPVPLARINTARAGSPSGLDFNIEGDVDGLLDPHAQASSQAKKAILALPVGMTINPSVGAGLGSCTPAEYAAETISSPPGAGCPGASKIGELTVKTPLFKGEIEGGMYLAQPNDPESPGAENPFNTLLALYLVAKDPDRGVLVRLAGKVIPNPETGQLVTTFDGLPQLPYSSFNVHFRDGQRTPLATPATCGSYSSEVLLSPWLEPASQAVFPSAMELETGIGGGACPTGIPPFHPRSTAGTMNRSAGAYTPYYLHITRTDAEQEITSYSATLPPGLLGKLRGLPYCPEAAIEEAKRNSGFGELRNPSCPAASSIGHTVSGYGLSSVLAYAPGGLYLAGPYHGAPLSIVAIDSATVGPFDLGVIVVRSAIRIDPRTAQVVIDSVGSDPIPHIVGGIPLHLRDIRVYIDRPNFTLNPTSCKRYNAEASLTGSGASFASPDDDTTASAGTPFQVSNCSALDFVPRFNLFLTGGTHRGDFPALKAVVKPRPGHANIAKAVVTMPPSVFLAQEHIGTVCTRVQFAAKNCPEASLYGHAKAITPLLGQPLEGPVYLRSSDNTLPDVVADLSGAGVRIEVDGRIDNAGSRMRATFENLPDAPVKSFTMNLKGGKKGILVVSDDLCTAKAHAEAQMTAQNNHLLVLRPRPQSRCTRAETREAEEKGRAR
jgi:hypothetical protein